MVAYTNAAASRVYADSKQYKAEGIAALLYSSSMAPVGKSTKLTQVQHAGLRVSALHAST
jgi:hypothetical protein